MTKQAVLAMLLFGTAFSGCASLAKYDDGFRYPYGATTTDCMMIWLSATAHVPPEPDPFDFFYSPWLIPLFLVDLPFSILTDTLTLPIDLYYLDRVKPAQSPGETRSTRCSRNPAEPAALFSESPGR
ncbi:MAG: YceK/YidQ family lipoprotein [Planctomycetota bacterium]